MIYLKKFEDFNYEHTIFTQQIPKNVVSPTERDIIQNVCVTHSNINHEIKALSIFIQETHLDKSLMLPTSTFELISNVICSDHKDFSKENVKSWKIECCNGECKKCGVEKFLSCYHQKLLEQISITDQSQISFSSWRYVLDEEKNKKVQILLTQKVGLEDFIKELKISVTKIVNHVRTMILQWNVFKSNPKNTDNSSGIIIRTCEDFQEDLKATLLEETVSAHRGQGTICVTIYPVAVEVIVNHELHLHALTFLS